MYPQAVRWIVEDALSVDAGGVVRRAGGASQLFSGWVQRSLLQFCGLEGGEAAREG